MSILYGFEKYTSEYLFNISVSVTDAVECYVCSTSLDGDSCGDPFKSAAKASDCAQCIKGKASADEVSGKKQNRFYIST